MIRTETIRCRGRAGWHEVALTETGAPGGATRPVLFCVHGVARNARDYDFFARSLAPWCRIVCPDLPGRGKSAPLAEKADYVDETYLADLRQILAERAEGPVAFVGSSLGGRLGLQLAAQPGSLIRWLVLVDVGPVGEPAETARIQRGLGFQLKFASRQRFERWIREALKDIGPLDDAGWRHLALHGAYELPDGQLAPAFDPGIATPYRTGGRDDRPLWEEWDSIRCPVLVVRGERSKYLAPATLAEMVRRGPPVDVVELPDAGHPPHLMTAAHIAPVREWLVRQWRHTAGWRAAAGVG